MDKNDKTKTPAVEIDEETLEDVQGGAIQPIRSPTKITGITDGTSNTITDGTSDSASGGGSVNVLLGDGSVRPVK